MSKKVKWGIIGCGVISELHGEALAIAKNAELIAVCDIIPERAEKAARRFGVQKVYTDYHQHACETSL